MDTNNITESFNNVLRRRYLPLRHDTTIFAFVQILIEIAFPEQEMQYVQATIKQTKAYRSPRYEIPSYLEGRPHKVQSLCLLNTERGQSIPKNHLSEFESGKFNVKSATGVNNWAVLIPDGKCTCPAFQSTNIPCKHFFAIFHHYPKWSWKDLPKTLTESSHMVLDDVTTNVATECDIEMNDSTTQHSQEIPRPVTTGARLYRLQKQIEETLARCCTLAYLTSDTVALEQSLSQCEAAMNTLASSATYTRSNEAPIVTAIEKAGVDEFKSTSKTFHRTGVKRKRSKGKGSAKRIKVEAKQEPLLLTKHSIGRPKLKRAQRKRPPLPRQVSDIAKAKMLKASHLVQKGL